MSEETEQAVASERQAIRAKIEAHLARRHSKAKATLSELDPFTQRTTAANARGHLAEIQIMRQAIAAIFGDTLARPEQPPRYEHARAVASAEGSEW